MTTIPSLASRLASRSTPGAYDGVPPRNLRRLGFRARTILAPACLALLLAGCASAPQERFYTLQAQTTPVASKDALPLQLILANLTLPDLVDKPQLVIRKNAQQVQILEQQRWAEPLKSALTQALAANLRAQGMHVSLRSDHLAQDNAWQLWVEVLQFESTPGKEALLEVQWQVRSKQGIQAFGAKGLWRESASGPGIEDVVAAHQRALLQCAQEMARSMQRLPAPVSASVGNTHIATPPAKP